MELALTCSSEAPVRSQKLLMISSRLRSSAMFAVLRNLTRRDGRREDDNDVGLEQVLLVGERKGSRAAFTASWPLPEMLGWLCYVPTTGRW